MAKIYSTNLTLVGAAQNITPGFACKSITIVNKHASNDYTLTEPNGTTTHDIPADSSVSLPMTWSGTGTLNGTGEATVYLTDAAREMPVTRYSAPGGTIAGASITGAMLANDTIDDTTFERVVAADAIDCTAVDTLAAFKADGIDNTFVQKVYAANAFGADANSRAAFETDFINAATADDIIATGALGEDLLTANEVDARAMRSATLLAATVADMSALVANRPTALLTWTVQLANAAAATYSFDNIPYGVVIHKVEIRKAGGASAGDTVKVMTDVDGLTGQVDLFTAVDMGAADGAFTVPTTGWAPAQSLVAAGGDIDVVTAGVAGNRACTLTFYMSRT